MALLFDARLRAIDSSGNPLTGATLTIYNANTTTPTAIFSDAALAVPMTNPVAGANASDAGGWFPQIFAAEGTIVDITLKNSVGATVQSYVDVTFVGADNGEFEREFTDGTRLKASGSGAVVYLEVGDPSPDNTGGSLVIGGWAGSQADSVTINSALVNVVGQIKENSKKLSGIISLPATQVTAQSSVDITLPNMLATTRAWEIEIFDYIQVGAGNFGLRMAYDAAPGTFSSGAADYTAHYTVSEVGASVTTNSAITTYFQISSGMTGTTNKPTRGIIRITSPASGSDAVNVRAEHSGVNNSTNYAYWWAQGYGPASGGHLAAIQLRMSGGTFTFKYIIRALRGYGEA